MGCGCLDHLKYLLLSDTSSTMDGSSKKSNFVIATPKSEADHATPSTSSFSSVDVEIERSKAHWSTLTEQGVYTDEEIMDFKMSNLEEFVALQGNDVWGGFFANFTGDAISTGINYKHVGELVVGKKFVEGAQGELYEVKIKWFNEEYEEYIRNRGCEFVVKVFKEGTLLKQVKSQLPQGLLQSHYEQKFPLPKEISYHVCDVFEGMLLKNGRFAIFMLKEDFDLRTLIERNMKLRSVEHCGPFSKAEVASLMHFVALGVEWLHNRDIIHKDLKASNVLIQEYESGWPKWACFVADYECSIGVVGINFFRAPEILLACKERKVNDRPEVFSRAADVYSYGMTCYEILTGKLPFEDHPLKNSPLLIDLVINEHLRPMVPNYVDDWVRKLLVGCWSFDPIARPKVGEILDLLLDNSTEVRRLEAHLKNLFSENHRSFCKSGIAN